MRKILEIQNRMIKTVRTEKMEVKASKSEKNYTQNH